MTGRRPSVSAVALTAVAVGLMLVLVMFAARAGPQRVVHGTLVDPSFGHSGPSTAQGPLHQLGGRKGDGVFRRPAVLTWLGWIIRVGLLLVVGWLAFLGLSKLREVVWRRPLPGPRPAQVDFEVLDDPVELVDRMRDDAADQMASLQTGGPRNAIVACWHRFEVQAERAGLARRPWETSSEFTLRVLDFASADRGAVARLERLYHEARFSEHEIDEERRTAAVDALQSIHASLPAYARAGR